MTPNEVAAVPDILPLSADATSMHRMPFGAEIQPDGEVHFRVWAPEASSLQLALEDAAELLAMVPVSDGWYELTTAAARAGSRYRFVRLQAKSNPQSFLKSRTLLPGID